MIPQLNKYDFYFPDPTQANNDGIVAWGGDLNPSRVLKAYQMGIFPWYNPQDPILWWSPSPRLIMELDDFKQSKSLKKSIKKFTYKFDTNFKEVIQKCASVKRSQQEGTWIDNEMIECYEVLHFTGAAHSCEAYNDGKLVGGLYGVVVGGVFCGESMFSEMSDASKSAFAILIRHLKKWQYDFVDAQVPTPHLQSLGAKEVAREYFLGRLQDSIKNQKQHPWEIDTNLL